MLSTSLLLAIVLAPLLGAVLAGLLGRQIGRAGAHGVTILGVGIACVLSFYVFYQLVWGGVPDYDRNIYTWFQVAGIGAHVGFLIDRLSALMMVVVSFVSLMVHIYTVGYMADDDGYQRFFSYTALFTFFMLMLVMSNNFLQLFFGWEGVGLVSYLLIGFWFKKPSASFAGMKAFIVNRVGDLGFVLGIAAALHFLGSLDYGTAFAHAPSLVGRSIQIIPGHPWSAATVICILLFIGAMGKSAQVPLHVWLPDSMEGPTPISALIHAATMVTAGVFMVARMSPLFELSSTALSVVLVIGATGAFFLGLIGITQWDIKRVVAYSTLSQLGYMMAALGASAYAAGMFHLMTHAFFKALLFLGAGSVIMAMHHEQDMRYMGGLRRYMPVTYLTMWVGSLALCGIPPFAGFYSKDAIIEAVGASHVWGASYAYWCVLLGVFVTATYTFRMMYLTFHGKERFHVDAHAGHGHDDAHGEGHGERGVLAHAPHESPWVVTLPLVLLAIPSLLIGIFAVRPLLYGNFFGSAIVVAPAHDVLAEMAAHFHGVLALTLHAVFTAPFWIAVAGIVVTSYVYLLNPAMADAVKRGLGPIYRVVDNKFYFDEVYNALFARGSVALGQVLWKGADAGAIDGVMVNGSASLVDRVARRARTLQSGFLYHYAFAMIVGLILLLAGFLLVPHA